MIGSKEKAGNKVSTQESIVATDEKVTRRKKKSDTVKLNSSKKKINPKEVEEEETIIKFGFDSGNTLSNSVSIDGYYDVFDSCVIENSGSSQDKDSIEFNNRRFIVGQGDMTYGLISQRGIETYEVLINYAICKYIKEQNITSKNIKIHLCIGFPTQDYILVNIENFVNYFDKKKVSCKYMNEEINFTIDEFRIVPQATVLAHNKPELFEDVDVAYILDFGSYTVNYQGVQNKIIQKNEKGSIPYGSLKLFNTLMPIIQSKGLFVETEKDIEKAFKRGYFISENEEELNISEMDDIQSLMEDWVARTVDELSRKIPKIKNSQKTICIGGGTLLYPEYIKKYVTNAEILEDGEQINAREYYYFIGGR